METLVPRSSSSAWLSFSKSVALLVAVILFSFPSAMAEEVYDPLEDVNRAIFTFNDTLDEFLIEPAAKGYDFLVPDPVEVSISNFFRNIRTPVYLVNDLLQLRFHDFAVHSSRFMLNSSIGVLGLFDVAKHFDLEHTRQDFGLTLGRYGVGPGPYLVLPLLGPSNLRDTTGIVVDYGLDPLNYTSFIDGISWEQALVIDSSERVLNVLNTRSRLLDTVASAKSASLDYYLFIRSAYNQNRSAAVRGAQGSQQNDEDMLEDEEEYIFEDDE